MWSEEEGVGDESRGVGSVKLWKWNVGLEPHVGDRIGAS